MKNTEEYDQEAPLKITSDVSESNSQIKRVSAAGKIVKVTNKNIPMDPSKGAIKKTIFKNEKLIINKKVTRKQHNQDEKPIIGGALSQQSIREDRFESEYETGTQNTKIKILENIQINRTPSPERMEEGAVGGLLIPSPTRLLSKRASISPDANEDEGEFISPRKTIPLSSIIHKKTKDTFELRNKYESLSDTSDSEDATEIGTQQSGIKRKINSKNKFSKKAKTQTNTQRSDTSSMVTKSELIPPPIVIEGLITDLKKLHHNISQKCKLTNTLNIKYTKNNTLLFVKNKTDYIKILDYCKAEEGVSFHTYTPSSEKTHAFVVRGLDNKPDPKDIIAAFHTEYDIELINAYEMHTKGRPLYLIVMSSAITLRYLQQNVKYLMCVRIFMEERENKKRIIQCHRCQVWGHATSNCYKPPKCVKCGEGHFTRDCKKSKETPAQCANCGGAHPASSVSCPVYKFRIGELNDATRRPQFKKYEPAPLPATNAWNTKDINKNLNENSITQNNDDLPSLSIRNVKNDKIIQNRNDDVAIGDIQDSQSLIAELDSLINIKEVNRAIRDLINALKESNSARGRFEIYYGFMQNLESSYNLI